MRIGIHAIDKQKYYRFQRFWKRMPILSLIELVPFRGWAVPMRLRGGSAHGNKKKEREIFLWNLRVFDFIFRIFLSL